MNLNARRILADVAAGRHGASLPADTAVAFAVALSLETISDELRALNANVRVMNARLPGIRPEQAVTDD